MRPSLIYFEKLRESHYERVRSLFQGDTFFREKILSLREAINRTRNAYLELSSFEFCKACAERGVRCCGEGLEWKLRPEEFLINLVLHELEGRTLLLKERSQEDCLFLGESGCLLILTPLFCRNFFCRELSEFLGHEGLIYLQSVLQEEAEITFQLCEYLKKRLSPVETL